MVMKDMEAGKDICSFLEKKILFFDRYLSITKRMKETFEDKGAGDLGGLLSERQDCINRIDRIDSSIKNIVEAGSNRVDHVSDQVTTPTLPSPFKGEGWGGGEKRKFLYNKFKGVIASHLKNLKNIMEKVDPMDRELMGMVKEESEGLKTELLKIRNAQQAARGYKRGITHPPRFLDKIR